MRSQILYALTMGASTLAATTAFQDAVRPHKVIHYLENAGHKIDWTPVAGNGSLATFSSDDWVRFENEARAAGDAERVERSLSVDLDDEQAAKRDLIFARASVTCFGSGSWALDSVLTNLVKQACESFSYTAATNSVQILRYFAYNEANDPMVAVFKFTTGVVAGVFSDDCEDLFIDLINNFCQGENSDTRGGTISDERGAFTVDPTTDNCNC